MRVVSLVLAAGHGTRMRSRMAKVLHPVAGRPMLQRAVETALAVSSRTIVVVGRDSDPVLEVLEGTGVETVVQEEQRGTGDAVLCARPSLEEEDGTLLVTCGDVPLVRRDTLEGLLGAHHAAEAAATLLTLRLDDPSGYGRILRDPEGRVQGIIEAGDASEAQRAVTEINTGICAFRLPDLWPVLERVGTENAQGEVYLTDVFGLLHESGARLEAMEAEDPEEARGINTRADLAWANRIVWDRNLRRLMEDGATILDPPTTFAGDEAGVDGDVLLHPGTILEGRTEIAAGAEVGPWTRLRDCRIGEGARILDHCVLEETRVAPGAVVGPFTRMRDGVDVGAGVQVGNFVEVKGSSLGAGTKAKHLAYLGNATIGQGVNIGAGTITCNHDGVRKHPTTVEDGAYVGSNATLVAPLNVGRGAYVGAGSVLTKDVPPDALAIARCRQDHKEGWAARRRERSKKREGD